MGETKITDETKADGEKGEKVEDGESLEDGEIREDEEEEEDDGKPKTVFDSAKKFNLKVSPIGKRHTTLNVAALLISVASSIHALDTLL